jgi:hypothetical protein
MPHLSSDNPGDFVAKQKARGAFLNNRSPFALPRCGLAMGWDECSSEPQHNSTAHQNIVVMQAAVVSGN